MLGGGGVRVGCFAGGYVPEYENEEDQKCEEDGHIVHCPQHDEQLAAQVGHEAHQF